MSISIVLGLLGGLALFLYGMQMMSSGLEAAAGNRMTPQPAAVPQVSLDDRAAQALGHLAAHESCGPTDLVRAYGSSAATWSRTLSALAAQGLVMKDGQKYRLTGIGRSFV